MLTIPQAGEAGNAISLPIARHRTAEQAPYPARLVARRHRLPIHRAALVAELAGYRMEAAYVGA